MIIDDKPTTLYRRSARNGGLLCEYMIISQILIVKAV